MTVRRSNKAKYWVWAGLLGGIALVAVFVLLSQRPAHNEQHSAPLTLTVIEVQPMPFVITARGFGITRPVQTWQAIANVGGRVVERHPSFSSGTLLPAGTLLMALDPSRYELAIAEVEAELASLKAEQTQLAAEANNTEQLQDLEKQRLQLSQTELNRISNLFKKGAISQSRLDEQQRAVLAQRQLVQSLNNQLALLPAKREQLKAQIQRASTRLGQRRADLADTRFVAPYDVRVRSVAVEQHQFVQAGQPLFLVDNIEQAEVEAQVPLAMLRRLMTAALLPNSTPDTTLDIAQRIDFTAIGARVNVTGFPTVSWPATVNRVASGLEPGTRSGRVVVTVDEPYNLANVFERPALQRDMHVQVVFAVPSPQPLLAVPSSAVHQGEVYLLASDNTLQRRAVNMAFEQNGLAVIAEGLTAGEVLIVDDPGFAVTGLPVTPHRDEKREAQLQQQAVKGAP